MESYEPSRDRPWHPIQPRRLGCVVPLTVMQSLVWRWRGTDGSMLRMRMCAGAVRVSGPLDRGRLKAAFERVIERHESLRTRIHIGVGELTQLVDSPRPYDIEAVDLSNQSPLTAIDEARRCVQEFLRQNIDLTVGPVLGARLIRLASDDHVLALALDHIVGDATSNGILSREIWESYDRGYEQRPTTLAARPLQFPDYAVWEQETDEERQRLHAPYWKARFAGAPHVQIPLGHEAGDVQDPASMVSHTLFDATLSAELRTFARTDRVLLPLVVLGLYVVVASGLCQQWDVTVWFPTHGRHGRPELEGMIGFLACSLLLRVEISESVSLADLMRQIQSEFDVAFEHADCGRVATTLENLKTELGFNWLPSKNTRRGSDRWEVANGSVRLQPFTLKSLQPVKFAPFFYDNGLNVGVSVHFRPDQLPRETAERFGRSLMSVARKLIEDPRAIAREVAQSIEV